MHNYRYFDGSGERRVKGGEGLQATQDTVHVTSICVWYLVLIDRLGRNILLVSELLTINGG